MVYDIEVIENLGALNYPLEKCMNVLGLIDDYDRNDFQVLFKDTRSEVYKHYMIGKDKAEYAIDAKVFGLAKAGDMDAVKMYYAKKSALAHDTPPPPPSRDDVTIY